MEPGKVFHKAEFFSVYPLIDMENLETLPTDDHAAKAAIQVLLASADTILTHVLGECDIDEVHMGMRVEAVSIPHEEWTTSLGNLTYFKASVEPDAAFDAYREHI